MRQRHGRGEPDGFTSRPTRRLRHYGRPRLNNDPPDPVARPLARCSMDRYCRKATGLVGRSLAGARASARLRSTAPTDRRPRCSIRKTARGWA